MASAAPAPPTLILAPRRGAYGPGFPEGAGAPSNSATPYNIDENTAYRD